MKNKQNLHVEKELVLKLLDAVNSKEEFEMLKKDLHHINSRLIIVRGFE